MAAILIALALVQDLAGEEIVSLLRRLESSYGSTAPPVELLQQLNRAVERAAPREARTLLGQALQGDRMPPEGRLDLAQALLGLDDRTTWVDEAARIALSDTEPPETRIRAALLLARAGAPRAEEVGRTLDRKLVEEGAGETARTVSSQIREVTSPEQLRLEIDYLLRLKTPAAAAALRDALADGEVPPAIRLLIAERLHAAGRLDHVRDAILALEDIAAEAPELEERAERLLKILREIREEALQAIVAEPRSNAPAHRTEPPPSGLTPARVNLIVGAATLVLLVILLARRDRG